MAQRNMSEEATSANEPFSREITDDDFKLLEDIISEMRETEELSCYDIFGLSIEFLLKQADSVLARGNNLYALRFYALVAALFAGRKDNDSMDSICSRMERIRTIIENESDYSLICEKTGLFIEALKVYNLEQEPVEFILEPYMDLVLELGFDDFHDKHYWGYIYLGAEENDIEFFFFHWYYLNNKMFKRLPHYDFIRDPLNNPSRAYVILRKEFNEKLLHSISENNVQNGKLLLKLAYDIHEYDQPLASKYAAKARAVFVACNYKEGAFWVNEFQQNIFREYFRHSGV